MDINKYVKVHGNKISEIALMVIISGLILAGVTGFSTTLWMKVVFISIFYLSLAIAIFCIRRNMTWKIISIIPATIVISYMLIGIGVDIEINIMVIISITIVALWHIYKGNSIKKKVSMGYVLIVVLGFLSWNYYIHVDNLIKDEGLCIHIKKENSIKGKIMESDLDNIKELSTPYERDVNTLQGIEQMKNLESICIWDARRIKDYSYISKLNNLNTITIWYGDLDKLSNLDTMNSVKNLGIIYPNKGKLQGLQAFPNLKVLEIKGGDIELSNLQGSKNIEKIGISSTKNMSFKGLDEFPKLTTLNLKEIYIEDIDEILKCESLSIIELNNCTLKDKEEFIQKANDKGISVIDKE
ncbi:hypothetical protein [Clostridium sp.]|uniref:hypothetical protein n=1 Tax=Clostridium sp. TaxID=1506 RepID=UPI003217C031